MMKLFIGNKNYSSWSMRPWVLMTELGIPFDEEMIYFDSFEPDSDFKRQALKINPTGQVPTLMIDGGFVGDTIAIAETLAEHYPTAGVWPNLASERALARSLCATMHAGFSNIRKHCPMNIEASFIDIGARLFAEQAGLRSDIEALDALLSPILANATSGGFLFGHYCAADAFYAPVASRFSTYGLPTSKELTSYFARLVDSQSMKAWTESALAEKRFVSIDEPYREKR